MCRFIQYIVLYASFCAPYMLRIPVCMHNVSEENIFRPSAWTAFGEDMEGSDYRACKNYGPLYK